MKDIRSLLSGLAVILFAGGCVGTDFIVDPAMDMSPQMDGPPSAITHRTGMFTKRPGVSYEVRGTAILEKRAPDSDPLILRFGSDFAVSNGPGIEVFLSTTNRVTSSRVGLGRVKRLTGEQSYDVPSGVRLDTFDWVIIHCVPFNVTFGYAQLQ
jgi:hypothetical protein